MSVIDETVDQPLWTAENIEETRKYVRSVGRSIRREPDVDDDPCICEIWL